MSDEKFEAWAIVELFGHQVIAGRVTDQAIGGETFIRVDVPAVGEKKKFTKMFGKGAIYAITPTEESTVKAYCERNREEPIHPYMLASPSSIEQVWEDAEMEEQGTEDLDF